MRKAIWASLLALFSLLILWVVLVGSPQPVTAAPLSSVFGSVQSTTSVQVGTFLRLQQSATVTLTENAALNPTGTFQAISSAAGVATSGNSITIKPAGTVVMLLNIGGQTITFTETGILKSAGNIVLGTLDSATLLSNGTNWYQIGASNN